MSLYSIGGRWSLRASGACLLPYPSAVFTKDDATSFEAKTAT